MEAPDISKIFLSTPSARRATQILGVDGSQRAISIHALREEGDFSVAIVKSSIKNFYPRPPRGGRRKLPSPQRRHRQISIHALREEGDVWNLWLCCLADYFYPRPPRGGRRLALHGLFHIADDFYPRPPRGGRQLSSALLVTSALFLSTPSARRATRVLFRLKTVLGNFYPRPPRGGRQKR